jgi:hypothetical protein
MRKDKRQWLDNLAEEAETSANNGNMKGVYDITKRICKEKPKQLDSVKDKNGKLLTKEIDVKLRWKEHFQEVLNRPEPSIPAEIDMDMDETHNLDIDITPPTKQEVKHILKCLKNGKSPGIDYITTELLKADIDTATNQIHKIITIAWGTEKTPDDWKKDLSSNYQRKGTL